MYIALEINCDHNPMKIPPHSYTQSPVEEVCFRFSYGMHAPVETIIPAPYPGWLVIREKIETVLESVSANKTMKSCMLRYTDVFALREGDIPHNLIYVAPKIPGSELFSASGTSLSEISMKGINHGSVIIIRFTQEKDRMILIFEALSDRKQEIWFDSVLQWFDFAREDIHLLFDLVVSDELKERLLI